VARELWEADRKRVQVGTIPPLSEKLAESQVHTAEANLSTAQELLETRRNILRSLLSDDVVGVPEELFVPLDGLNTIWANPNKAESLEAAMKQRPDLIEARLMVERDGILVRYHQNQLFPTLDLVGSYGALGINDTSRQDTITETSPAYSVGVELKVPLGNRQARNKHRASQEMKMQALLNLKKVEQTVYVEVDNTLKSIKKIYERIDSMRKAREYAETAFEAEKQKLADGRSTTFVVSEYERNLVTARTAEILANVDYNKALARLAYDEGTTLEKNQVKVDFK
jgi:outer membrane protein